MPDRGRVQRFRDHSVAGVNWRPTRFVDEVPSSRVCGLCRMIPQRTLLLPCDHVLCQSCHAGIAEGGGGRCPFDQEPFEDAECTEHNLPARKGSLFKVYCWNEDHGCQFEGSIEHMLTHYENECTFHAVECLRCGEAVPHKDLPAHYVAGCNGDVSSASPDDSPSESAALTPQGVAAAVEEFKTLLRDSNHEQLLLTVQSQVNRLAEQVRAMESLSAGITREVTASVKAEMTEFAAKISTAAVQEATPRTSATEEASSTSTSQSCPGTIVASQQPDAFADLPQDVLRNMRQTWLQDYPQHAVTYCVSGTDNCHLILRTGLSTTRTWREVKGDTLYVVTVQNIDRKNVWPMISLKFLDITVLHTRDSYFTVQASKYHSSFDVRIVFHGMRGGSLCSAPKFTVRGIHWYTWPLDPIKLECRCDYDSDSWAHFCSDFYSGKLIRDEFIDSGKVEFSIELSRVNR